MSMKNIGCMEKVVKQRERKTFRQTDGLKDRERNRKRERERGGGGG